MEGEEGAWIWAWKEQKTKGYKLIEGKKEKKESENKKVQKDTQETINSGCPKGNSNAGK